MGLSNMFDEFRKDIIWLRHGNNLAKYRHKLVNLNFGLVLVNNRDDKKIETQVVFNSLQNDLNACISAI